MRARTLYAIAQALDVPLAKFFIAEQPREPPLVKEVQPQRLARLAAARMGHGSPARLSPVL